MTKLLQISALILLWMIAAIPANGEGVTDGGIYAFKGWGMDHYLIFDTQNGLRLNQGGVGRKTKWVVTIRPKGGEQQIVLKHRDQGLMVQDIYLGVGENAGESQLYIREFSGNPTQFLLTCFDENGNETDKSSRCRLESKHYPGQFVHLTNRTFGLTTNPDDALLQVYTHDSD